MSLTSARSSGTQEAPVAGEEVSAEPGLPVNQELAQPRRPGEHLVRALGQPRLPDEQRHTSAERPGQQREQDGGNQERPGEQPPELGGLAGQRRDRCPGGRSDL